MSTRPTHDNVFLLQRLAYSAGGRTCISGALANLHKTSGLRNIIFVILTSFHLTIFLDKKNSDGYRLEMKWLMKKLNIVI